MAEIYDKMESFKAALLKRERAASSRLVRAYGQSWQRLAKLLLQVTDRIGEAQAQGLDISPAWLYQQERYARLMTELEREIRKFAATAERAVVQEQQAAVKAALRDSTALVKASAAPEISASFVSLNAAAVESAVGFLADGSPLSRLLDEVPRETGRRVREALTEAVALGYNPRKTAARVRREAGMALTRALRIARTETLRAYREAAHANYKANDDIIQGWYWAASLSRRTCAACIALHGTFHPLEERMASHVQCRCTAIPALTGRPSPIAESGEAWFGKQPEATQRAILGTNAGYEALKGGDLRLRDFVGEKRNLLWGKSYVQLGVKRAMDGEARFPKFTPPTDTAAPTPAPFSPPVVRNYREFTPGEYGSQQEVDIGRYADMAYPLNLLSVRLAPQEFRSVQDYVGNWYKPINNFLRGKTRELRGWDRDEIRSRVKHIDAALQKTELAEDTILYRGAQIPRLHQLMDSGELIGGVWPEDAYMSTSLNKEVARHFADPEAGTKATIIRIKANKGQKGTYVSHVNREFHPNDAHYHNQEGEVLLPRNTGLYITDAKYVKIDGRKVLELEAEIWTEELAATRKAKILTTKKPKTTR